MAEVNSDLRNHIIEVSSGEVITVTINGQQELLSVQINPNYLTADNAALLGDLITATVNNACKQSRTIQEEAMSKVTGKLNLPHIPGLF